MMSKSCSCFKSDLDPMHAHLPLPRVLAPRSILLTPTTPSLSPPLLIRPRSSLKHALHARKRVAPNRNLKIPLMILMIDHSQGEW